jgi:hypothetical protein
MMTAAAADKLKNKLPRMNGSARRETYCSQAVQELITSFYSKRLGPSGVLIHGQNSHTPPRQLHTGCRELVNRVKDFPVHIKIPDF